MNVGAAISRPCSGVFRIRIRFRIIAGEYRRATNDRPYISDNNFPNNFIFLKKHGTRLGAVFSYQVNYSTQTMPPSLMMMVMPSLT